MVDAIDFSSYTAVPSQIQIDCLKRQGVRRAIIGTRGNNKFGAQVGACSDLEVEAYLYLYFDQSGSTQAFNCMRALQPFPQIKRVWLDVELDAHDPNPGSRQVVNCLNDAIAGFGNKYALGIYTSQYYWNTVFRMPPAYSHLPLWDANYHTPPRPFTPYGGWTERAMVQYAGSVMLCDLNVDLNMIEEDEMPLSDDDLRKISQVVKLELELAKQDQQNFISGRFLMLIKWMQENIVAKLK